MNLAESRHFSCQPVFCGPCVPAQFFLSFGVYGTGTCRRLAPARPGHPNAQFHSQPSPPPFSFDQLMNKYVCNHPDVSYGRSNLMGTSAVCELCSKRLGAAVSICPGKAWYCVTRSLLNLLQGRKAIRDLLAPCQPKLPATQARPRRLTLPAQGIGATCRSARTGRTPVCELGLPPLVPAALPAGAGSHSRLQATLPLR